METDKLHNHPSLGDVLIVSGDEGWARSVEKLLNDCLYRTSIALNGDQVIERLKDIKLDDLLKKSAEIVQIDIDKCVQAKRLHGIDKHKRDLIVYFLWNKGLMTNEKLGQLFNMSYSAVSHCVKIVKEKMNKDRKVKNQFEKLNSLFKL